MALEIGVNSYISIADANAYFADRLDAGAWENATEMQKTKALVTAANRIDMQRLRGKCATTTQKMQFPRCYWSDCSTSYIGNLAEAADGPGWLCEIEPPQAVLDAQCEEALYLLGMTDWDRERQKRQQAGIVDNMVGEAREMAAQAVVLREALGGQRLLSPVARRLMAPYLQGTVTIT